MDSIKIEEALAQLDPTNDEHWTVDGLPRLDVLSQICGQPVGRAELQAIAPKFTRAHVELGEVTTMPEAPEENSGPPQENVVTEPEPEPEPAEALPGKGETNVSNKELVQTELDEAREVLAKAQQRYKKALAAMDEIIEQESVVSNQRTFAEDVKKFQQSQSRQRVSVAQRRQIALDAIAAAKDKA